ncbi:alginate lyase family protein [Cognatiyoonia sp. IB215182]|uniref:alginate lyase family protein n=1 Tax=Cognatiyoonia sp. IB215182 TaxID=3097353 RepID=UPI002A176658|nr:alginate lyase family protein [Cognatiyoonia sp. IB215182]MDX8354909.1 alginate lyase family protein [Cognatiyoonia sp. IB215182]
MNRLLAVVSTIAMTGLGAQAARANDGPFVCPPTPEPVVSLSYGSRYTAESESRSDIDEDSNAAVNAALAPIETFIRDLVRIANDVTAGERDQMTQADCVIDQLATWAEADALSELGSYTAQLSVGSRLAGLAMIYKQVAPYSSNPAKRLVFKDWLAARTEEQMLFWEQDATSGARLGNLRGWATLGINLSAEINDDPVALRWSAWSASLMQCEAREDGSLPQETRRGKYALHYQLHAIAPMVVTTLLLEQQGLSIKGICDNALDRIVRFALDDLETGEASRAYSGEVQSYFDGTEELRSFQLAWLEAYLALSWDPELDAFAEGLRPLGHSKLGGSQALLWGTASPTD